MMPGAMQDILILSCSIPSQNIDTGGLLIFARPLYKLSWSQNFGNKALKDKRNRKTSSEDERKRVD